MTCGTINISEEQKCLKKTLAELNRSIEWGNEVLKKLIRQKEEKK